MARDGESERLLPITSLLCVSSTLHPFSPSAMPFEMRLRNELKRLQRDSGTSGISVAVDDSKCRRWVISFTGPADSLFAQEQLQLQFVFPDMYPVKAPAVRFIGSIPMHPHVYSDGRICLSILTSGWTPELSVESVVVSVMSMLASCKEKKRPPDDRRATSKLVKLLGKQSFVYDDDDV